MSVIYTKGIAVNKVARNKRPYGNSHVNFINGGIEVSYKATNSEVITANSETIINKYIAPDHLHLLETYCVGGRGDSSNTHVVQLVATDQAIPGVTVYSDQEIIW